MSYIYSTGLQSAIYQRLSGDPELSDLIGAAIYDAPLDPETDEGAPDYILLGEETVRPNDTKTSHGSKHDLEISVHSGRDGFDPVKRIAAAVCDCLVDAEFDLERGYLVGLQFLGAKAERGPAPVKRKISLRFRATIDGE